MAKTGGRQSGPSKGARPKSARAGSSGKRSGRTEARSTSSRLRIGIILLAAALVGGLLITLWDNRTPAASPADGADSFYREATMQQVADIIRNSEHALIYYRSPT